MDLTKNGSKFRPFSDHSLDLNWVNENSVFQENFDLAEVGIANFTIMGQWIRGNQAACRILGYPDEYLRSLNFLDIIHPSDRESSIELGSRLNRGEIEHFTKEVRFLKGDDTYIWTQVTVSIRRQSHRDAQYAIVVIQDITEKKSRAAEREALLTEIRNQKALLEAVMNQLPMGASIAEAPSGRVSLSNPRARRIWNPAGLSIDSLSEYPKFLSFSSDGRMYQAEDFPIARSILNGECVHNEIIKIINSFGENRIVSVSSAPVFDEENKCLAAVALSRDVTEEVLAGQELRESEQRFRTLTHHTVTCLVLMNSEGIAYYLNPSAQCATGYLGVEEVQDRPWIELVVDQSENLNWREYAQGQGKVLKHQNGYFRRKDGVLFPSLFSLFPLENEGKFLGLVLEFQDISDQRRAEQELIAALAARDEFISVASHELKTPLTSLYLQLQLLQRNLEKNALNLPESFCGNKNIKSCLGEAERMITLIDELMDLTRIRLGRIQLNLKKMNLTSLIKDLCQRYVLDAERRGIEIALRFSHEIWGVWDPIRIGQVFSNLLSNALKYGEEKPIEVSLEFNSTQSQAVMKVKDQGFGISEEAQRKIFDCFERASEAKKIAGLGLGLYVSKKIIEAHDGFIQVESRLGQGSIFSVTLPCASLGRL